MRVLKLMLSAVIFLSLMNQNSKADEIYTYTGNPFTTYFIYNASDKVTATFDFSSPLAVNATTTSVANLVSFSFSDGYQTIDQSNYNYLAVSFQVDGSGNISQWDLEVSGVQNNIITKDLGTVQTTTDSGFFVGSYGSNSNSPGSWGYQNTGNSTSIPEPASMALSLTALAGLGALRRRRANSAKQA